MVLVGMVLVAAVVAAIGWYFSERVIHPKIYSVDETFRIEVEAGKLIPAEFEALPRREITIRSPHGYDLFGLYFPVENARGVVIVCHGITFSLYGSVKYLPLFRSRGYAVVLIDHRYHGRSGGANSSFGYFEKHDVSAWADWARDTLGPLIPIGLHGESFGAAVIIQAMAVDSRFAFGIADCAFSDLTDLLAHRLRQDFGLPAWPIVPLASALTKLRAGWRFADVSPRRDITAIAAPILFVHGDADQFTPARMSRELFNAKPDHKHLYLVSQADHAEAYWRDRAEYDRVVGEFLDVYFTATSSASSTYL